MTPTNFGYEQIIEKALAAVPEIRAAYKKEVSAWTTEKFGPYNLFDMILMPHVIDLLKSEGHQEELRRTFDFFETLMGHPTQDVRDVVAVAVCETLCSDESALQKACAFMGPETKKSCDAYLK